MAFRYPSGYSPGILRPRNRARQPSHSDRYGHGGDICPDVYFDRLCLNPPVGSLFWDIGEESPFSPRTRIGGPTIQGFTADPFSPTPRAGAGGRARQDQRLRDLGMVSRQRSELGDAYVERGPRPEILGERESDVPFASALKGLHRKLETAEKFYENFETGYEDDTNPIKAYATREILEKLWTRKLRAGNVPKADSINRDEKNDGDILKYGEGFATYKREVGHALEETINSRLDEGTHDSQSSTCYEARSRLMEKLRMAFRQFLPLLEAASQGPEQCKVLLVEIQRLKDLVDPKNEKNKIIFKTGDQTVTENKNGMVDGSAAGSSVVGGSVVDSNPVWKAQPGDTW